MKIKKIIIVMFFVVGINFQYCTPFNCDCPPVDNEYFDIKDIGIVMTKKIDSGIENVSLNDVILFSELYEITLFYEVDFISCNNIFNKNLSLINSAYACSCFEEGYKGSKNEKLENLTIITLNDFDTAHKQNDTINDLFDIGYSETSAIAIDKYLTQDTSFIKLDYVRLYLQKAPVIDENFSIKVVAELSTGETYETQNLTIKILN